MVCRLIQQEEIRLLQEQFAQSSARLLPSAELQYR